MIFLWPSVLFGFVLLAALPFAYVWLLRRRKQGLRVASLDLIKQAVGKRPSLRRHLPPAVMYAALLMMGFALARPAAVITLPTDHAAIMLAIDISGSMRAQDVEPNRMAAAQAAARTFITDQPRNVKIGLVAFSTNAQVIQPPTLSRSDLIAGIDRLFPQRYTAVGSGIMASLNALFPEMELDLGLGDLSSREPQAAPLGARVEPPKAMAPVAPGSLSSAVVILLTDGQTNAGIRPLDAAQVAADRGVRVFTVGFGSAEGGVVDFGRGSMRVQLDEETLKGVAEVTRARYYNAKDGADLREIYKTLSAQFIAETKRTELTGLLAAPAIILMLLAAGLSLLWSNRMT